MGNWEQLRYFLTSSDYRWSPSPILVLCAKSAMRQELLIIEELQKSILLRKARHLRQAYWKSGFEMVGSLIKRLRVISHTALPALPIYSCLVRPLLKNSSFCNSSRSSSCFITLGFYSQFFIKEGLLGSLVMNITKEEEISSDLCFNYIMAC